MGEAPEKCPFCGSKYPTKPGLEFALFKLQDEFLADYERTGSTRILGEKMFPIIAEYAENLIKMLLKGKACISFDSLQEKANDAATKLIEVILKDPSHRMRTSFGGYLKRLCTNEAYRDQKYDQTYSMQFLIGDDTEFGDTISRKEAHLGDDGEKVVETVTMRNRYDEEHTIESDLCSELCAQVGNTASIIREQHCAVDAIYYLLGLKLKLTVKNDKAMEDFYEAAGNNVRELVEKGEMVIYRRLQWQSEAA
jgi:hypothetical protein